MAEPVAPENKNIVALSSTMAPQTIPIQGGLDPLHELRVRIPVDLHRQLLSLKVLRGKSLAETVSTALDIYFQEHARKVADASGDDA